MNRVNEANACGMDIIYIHRVANKLRIRVTETNEFWYEANINLVIWIVSTANA